MSSGLAVGIDLGTANSAVARVDDLGRTSMVRNAQGELLIASIVFFEDDELVFGGAAKQAAAIAPNLTAEWIKRDRGQQSYSRAIGGELLPVALVEGCLLHWLASDLETEGTARPSFVVSHPASFHYGQREALVAAAELAGIDLLGTIDEPLAAALAFAEHQGYLRENATGKPGCRVLVFDLGGGKLDVAIVEIKPWTLRTLAVGGDARLGGRDWDLRLADYLAAEYERQCGQDPRYDLASVRRVLQTAEEIKHTLSARAQAKVHLEREGKGAEIVVTREAFETITQPLVERARQATEELLARAGLAWRDVAHLLLVGGATRMPMIGAMLESLTRLKPTPGMHPDEAVARGAALAAEQLLAEREGREAKSKFQIANLTARGFGVEWQNRTTGQTENVVVIPRATELPCSTTSSVGTEVEGQETLTVRLLEGESRQIEQCAHIGRAVISNLPHLPINSQIEVEFALSASGKLDIGARLPKSGQRPQVSLEREHGLSAEDRAFWSSLIARPTGLKAIHARLASTRPAAPEQPASVPIAAVAAVTAPMGAVNAPVAAVTAVNAPVLAVVAVASAAVNEAPPPLDQVEPQGIDDWEAPATKKKPKTTRSLKFHLINAAGFAIFSALGLVIGYYIFLVLRPEWNVLELPLPGLPRPAKAEVRPANTPPSQAPPPGQFPDQNAAAP